MPEEQPRKISGSVEVNPGCLWIFMWFVLLYVITKATDKIVAAIHHIK